MKYYAGIGSRETPKDAYDWMVDTGYRLEDLGYTLRSGGADGADTAFEMIVNRKEIFLPWEGFNNNPSPYYVIPPDAFIIAAKYHPYYMKLKDSVKALMARNVQQVLGPTLDNHSEFVLCWTKDGKASGGTGQAIRIAEAYNIPVFNIRNGTDAFEEYISSGELVRSCSESQRADATEY